MSSTIAIPSARGSKSNYGESSKAASSSSSSSSYSTSPQSPEMSTTSPLQSTHRPYLHQRRPSLLSTSFCKDECTVINIGDPDGPPRLISYLSSSQGFVWNPEIFLPSYVDCEYVPLENRREPVHEIRLSDDEIKNMLPQ